MTEKPCPSPTRDLVTLREYFDEKFRHLYELRMVDAKALALQAGEYERRLEGLNGEWARVTSNQATYVSRELWDKTREEEAAWRTRVEQFMAAQTGTRKSANATWVWIISVVAALSAFASMVLVLVR